MILNNYLLSLLVPISVVAFLAHWLFCRLFWRHSIPSTIPWAGSHDGRSLSRARAVIRSLLDTRGLLVESYAKYSQNGLPYVLPNLIQGPEVILPQNMVDWLLQQPDNVLDQSEVNRDFLQADFTMLHPKVAIDTVHGEVIKKVLTRRLGEFTGDVLEEVDFAFRSAWGVDTDNWKTVTAYDTMSEIISRVSNRVLVGLPLCRNEDYLYYSSRFARFVILESAAIHLFPNILRPFVAPIVTLFDYRRYLRMAKHIIPIWKRRTSAPIDDKQKSDYVQWCLDFADDRRDPEERSSDMISKRLAALTFAAIQSSVITSTNLLFDLAASDQTPDLFNLIRKEVDLELELENGAWNKNSLARMVTLDSTLRESMRLGGFVSRGILKTVAAKDGIKLPGPNGAHLPYGTKVGTHAYPVHYDEQIYPRAKEFEPLRFCQSTPAEGNTGEKALKSGIRGTPLVNTSPIFMGFSHGRHACPGRFFAAQQLKLVLAYVALNYEIFPIPQRPQNKWLIGSSGPPLDATITIRRRKGTVV